MDPDPSFHFDADPDSNPTFLSDVDPYPGPTFQFDADPDPFTHFFTNLYPPIAPKWPSKASTFSRSFGSRSCFYFDADAGPDPGFHFDAFPDPAFHNDEDPDPQHCKNVSSPFRSSRTYKYIWMSLPSPPVEE